jgi:hypothetical protein
MNNNFSRSYIVLKQENGLFQNRGKGLLQTVCVLPVFTLKMTCIT